MGDEEDFENLYREGDDVDGYIGKGGCGVVLFGWRRIDKKEVAINKVHKSKVVDWDNVYGKAYPIEYCHLLILATASCSRIANILD